MSSEFKFFCLSFQTLTAQLGATDFVNQANENIIKYPTV